MITKFDNVHLDVIQKHITDRNAWLIPAVKKVYDELIFEFTEEPNASVIYQMNKATVLFPKTNLLKKV